MGVDSRAGLARAEAVWQRRRRDEAMEAGVTLLDPDSVWFSHDTVLDDFYDRPFIRSGFKIQYVIGLGIQLLQ